MCIDRKGLKERASIFGRRRLSIPLARSSLSPFLPLSSPPSFPRAILYYASLSLSLYFILSHAALRKHQREKLQTLKRVCVDEDALDDTEDMDPAAVQAEVGNGGDGMDMRD